MPPLTLDMIWHVTSQSYYKIYDFEVNIDINK